MSILDTLFSGDHHGKYFAPSSGSGAHPDSASWGGGTTGGGNVGAIVWNGGSTLNVSNTTIQYARTGVNLNGDDALVTLNTDHFVSNGTAITAVGWTGPVNSLVTSTFVDVDNEINDRFDAAGVSINLAGNTSDNWFSYLGSTGNDVISGTAGKDAVLANQGNDEVRTRGGNDAIFHNVNTGNDIVDGGSESSGKDTLIISNVGLSGGNGNALDPADAGDPATSTAGNPSATKVVYAMTDVADTVGPSDGTNSTRDISITMSTDAITPAPLGSVTADEIEDVQFNLGSGGDTVNISGDFTNTSLSASTITVVGGVGGDIVNASGLSSAHAINFNGGGGDDTFVSSNAAAADTFTGGANGANGDTANYSAVTSSITVDLSNTIGSNVSGGAGNDTLTDVENVTGGQVGDSITGSSVANVLSGGGGNDTITGGGGNDTIYGGTATADAGTADAANFAGALATYQVTFDPFQAADADGLDATVDGGLGNVDTTHGVELLQFTGATLDLSDKVFLFDSANHLVGTFDTIQSAVDAVGASNMTIKIRDGVYEEQVEVAGKTGLTILGQSEAGVIIKSPAGALATSGTSDHWGDTVRANISVENSTGVVIRNLTVDGDYAGDRSPGSNGDEITGVFFKHSSGTVDDVTVQKVSNSTGGGLFGLQHGSGILVDNGIGAQLAVTISDSTVQQFQKTGILVWNANVTLTNNDIIGVGATALTAQNAMQIGGSSGTIGGANAADGNTFGGVGYTGGAVTSTDLIVYEPTAALTISNNTFEGTGVVGSLTVGIDLTDVAAGIIVTVTDNAFGTAGHGLFDGIDAYTYEGTKGLASDPVMSGNTFTEITNNGIFLDPEFVATGPAFTTTTAFTETGSQFADVLHGSNGADNFSGGAGDDDLMGRGGDDTLSGDGGDDIFTYRVGDGIDTVHGGTEGANGDLLRVSNVGGLQATITLDAVGPGNTDPITVDLSTTADIEVTADEIEDVTIDLGANGDTVVVNGPLGGTSLDLNTITVNGGAGGDTVDATTLSSAHRIVFNGGDGDDTFRSSSAGGNDSFAAGTTGETNGDTVDYSAVTGGGVNVNLGSPTGTATDIGGIGVGSDTLTGVDNVIGTAQADIITGSATANTLTGGGGSDTITGGGGNDTISGGSDVGTVASHDIAVFSDVIGNYTFDFTTTPGSVIVKNTLTDETDTVTGVEELQFSGSVSVALVNVAGSSLDTIQEGVNASTEGGRVYVGDGTYNENVSIAKGIGIVGIGSNVNVHGNFKTDNPAVDASHGGSVADFLETAAGYSGASGSAFTITASNVAINNINIDSFRDGVILAADVSNITLTNLDITDTILGIANDWGYSNIERSLSNLTITGGSISDGHNGINFEKGGAPAGIKHITGVTITGTQFSELTAKGIYFEDLSNATITGVNMNHVGYWGGEPTFGGNASGSTGFGGSGIELNLKKGAFSNIAITNFNLINTGTSNHDGTASSQNVQDNGAAISVKIRSANANYSPVSYTGTLNISNGTIDGTSTGIRAGENNQTVDGPAVNVSGVTILGAAHDAKNGDIENLTTSLMSVTGKAAAETWWISEQSTGPIKIDDIGGADTVTYNGTTAAETFNVNLVAISGTDYVAINKVPGSPAPALATDTNYELATHDVEDLVINTGNGGDTVVVTGTLNGTGLSTSTITVNGGTGNDTVDASGLGSDHRIVFNGGDGNDTFKSSARDNAVTDEFHGGNNTDTVDYSAVTSGGVTVDLSNALAQDTVSAGTDLITGVENVTGSNQADTLTGNSGDNVITGNGGNDALRGGGGNDTLAGGSETDTALYADGPAGYTVTISGGTTTVTDIVAGNGDEGTDTLTGVETLDFNGTTIDLTAPVLVYTGDYSGTGPGALKASYGSIAAALAGASTNPGDTVIVKAGSYSENITIAEGVILRGLGTVTLNGSVVVDGGGALQNVLIDNIDVNGTGNYAVQVAETSTYTSVAFKNGNVTGGNYGGLLLGDGNEAGGPNGVGTLVIENAAFSGNVLTGSGGGGDGAILIYRYNGNVTLKNVDVTGGANVENGIQIRGAAALAPSGTLSFENVDVHGTFVRTGVAIRDFLSTTFVFNGSVGNSALDVDVTGGTAYTGLHIDNVGGTVNLSGANAVDVTHYVLTTGAITMTGTSGAETFTGDVSNDVLVGAGGNDTLDGAGGNDIYVEIAGDGTDTVNDSGPGADSDTLAVFGVGTTVSAAPANNGAVSDTVSATVVGGKLATLDGGTVTGIEVTAINLGGNGAAGDTLDYTGTGESVSVNLGTSTASGFNAGAFNIENVTGGSVNDSLTGSASANVLSGAGGDDTFKGNGGDDTLHGGAGTADTAVYDDASSSYTVTYNVNTGDATVAETAVAKGAIDEGTDTLDGVELLDFGSGDIDLNAKVLVFSSYNPNTGTGTLKSSHSTIQSAVNSADGNDTVYIRNGSYTEQVFVGTGKDSLTILGQSEAGVVIHAPTTGLTSFATDPNANPVNRQLFSVVTVAGSDLVTIRNLTVDGDSQAGQVAGSGDFNGIAYVNSSGTVEDVTVREIRDTLAGPTQVSGNQRGNAVLATYTAGSPKQFNLIDSTITDYQKTGVVMRNATVNLDDNTVTGFGVQDSQAQNGIQLSSGSTGIVNNNHISALGLTSGAASASGILLFNAGIVSITGNGYTGTAVEDIAIALVNTSGTTISGNIITTATQGVAESGTMTVENNVVNTGAGANSYSGITTWNHEIEFGFEHLVHAGRIERSGSLRHRRRRRHPHRQRRRRLPAGGRRHRPDARRRRQRHHRVDRRRRQRHDDRRRRAHHRRHAGAVRHRGCRHDPAGHQRRDAGRHRRRRGQRAGYRDRLAQRDRGRHRYARLHRNDDGREREPRDQRVHRHQCGRRAQHDRERHRRLSRRHAGRFVRRQHHQRRGRQRPDHRRRRQRYAVRRRRQRHVQLHRGRGAGHRRRRLDRQRRRHAEHHRHGGDRDLQHQPDLGHHARHQHRNRHHRRRCGQRQFRDLHHRGGRDRHHHQRRRRQRHPGGRSRRHRRCELDGARQRRQRQQQLRRVRHDRHSGAGGVRRRGRCRHAEGRRRGGHADRW